MLRGNKGEKHMHRNLVSVVYFVVFPSFSFLMQAVKN